MKLRDAVVVITGASSGIGRAAALAFAEQGANLVLAARGEEPLRQVASECEQLGVRALAVPTNVSDEESVKNLATHAVESFGRIDVWINNAAVTMFARFEEAPSSAFRHVIETNLFGYIYGARAAMPHFREQRRGVLINNASIAGAISQPYTSAYNITKFGVRALSESLRQELYLDGARDIHVCTLLPAVIDTPLFQHGANYTGWTARPMPPVYSAEQVAAAMVRLAQSPQREQVVGTMGRMLNLMRKVAPGTAERMLARQVHRKHFDQSQPAEPSDGNLYGPMTWLSSVSGGWQKSSRRVLRRMAPLGLAALSAGLLARSRRDLMRRLGLQRRQPSLAQRLVRPIERAVGR